MSTLAYRIIDAGHGALMLLLLFFIGRLLLVRHDSQRHVRCFAGIFLMFSCFQTGVFFYWKRLSE